MYLFSVIDLQTGLALIVVALAVWYAAFRIYRWFVTLNDPCAGCEGCLLKSYNSRKNRRQREKNRKKFGCFTKKQ